MKQLRLATKNREATHDPQVPSSVRNAVRCMYAGAALSGITVVLQFVTIAAERNLIKKQHPHYTAVHIHDLVVAAVAQVSIVGVISVGLWVLIARTNLAGRSWARIAASVLFALNTLDLITSVRFYGLQAGLILAVLTWLVGLAAIVLLWRRESSDYLNAVTDQRRKASQLG